MDWLAELLAPIMHLIEKKFEDMMDLERKVSDLKKVIDAKHGEDDAEELQDLQEELESLQDKVKESANVARAWGELPNDERWEMIKAADYTDGWFHVESTRTSFRIFYVCNGKNVPGGCATVQTSASWRRKFTNPLQAKQAWYCNVCGCRYKTSMGVMLEMRRGDMSYYMKAEFPPQDIQDLKGMVVEENVPGAKNAASPDELIKLLPDFHPVSIQHFQECNDPYTGEKMAGVFRANPEWMKDLPEFQWDTMYKICGLNKPEKKKKTK